MRNSPLSRDAISSTLIPVTDTEVRLAPLQSILATIPASIIACSGGIDSMLLATVASRQNRNTLIAHAVSPAVPAAATDRVKNWAVQEGWNLRLVTSGEFQSEAYLSNPVNRCYYCKSNLYSSLEQLAGITTAETTLLSGANLDDLGEYRPGLIAAAENKVRHPYIEAEIDKAMIRAIARQLQLPFSELPASPCLASRLYTGTRVTPARLHAIDSGETLIRAQAGIEIVRCRIREDEMFIEVGNGDREKITPSLIADVLNAAKTHEPQIRSVQLDVEAYRAGRAFIGVQEH